MSLRARANDRLRHLIIAATGLIAMMTACEGPLTPPGVAPPPGIAGPALDVAGPGEYTHVYVHAHQDDWQLFMGDRAHASLSAAANVVFIYTTAGDENQSQAFWMMRETAARTAVDSLIGSGGAWTCGTQTINAHPIVRCTRGKTVSYFMRLPDGGLSGEGWGGRGSLGFLRDGYVAQLTTRDGATTYPSWVDVTLTIRGIIDHESGAQGAPFVEVHASETNRVTNPGDHLDHLATGDAVRAAAAARSWNLVWYVDYHTRNMPVNVSPAAQAIKQRAFYGYDYTMSRAGFGATRFEPEYQAWLWRTYSRTETSVPTPPPAPPTTLATEALSAAQVRVTWLDNSGNEGGFHLERAPDAAGVPGDYSLVASLAPNTVSFTDGSLPPSTAYWYRVRAFGTGGNSAYAGPVSATTLAPPAPPTNLAVAVVSSSRIDLSWTDAATTESGYMVERAPDDAGAPGAFTPVATLAANVTAFSNTGLTANTTYWYRVRAVAGPDASAFAGPVSGQTPQPPAAPTSLAALASGSTTIDLTWTDNATTETGYAVERASDAGGAPGAFGLVASLPAGSTSHANAGLASGTRYWFRVRATAGADVSAFSNSASATTPIAPPVAPGTLSAQPITSSRIDLAWSAATGAEGYYVERAPTVGGSPGAYVRVATVSTTSFSSTALDASTQYWYRVQAYNAGGASPYGPAANATTLDPPTSRVDFYVHAHQDDWQLFMGDRAYASMQTAAKVVFVYTTAGDENQGTAFWTTRELAAQNAVDTLFGSGGSWACGTQIINAHPIRRCARGKAVAYYLRLPDGGLSGEGWGGRGSLMFLRDGWVQQLTTRDGATTYTSWNDVLATLRGLVDVEAAGQAVDVHAPDGNRAVNVGDHPDHSATGDAMRLAAAPRTWSTIWYLDYVIRNMPVNLSQAAHDIKQRAFYGYDYTMSRAGFGATRFEPEYQAWLWRTYTR